MTNEFRSLLTDDEIDEEAESIARELRQGERMHLADIAARFGISLDDAIALAEEVASEHYGRPMRFVRVH